MVNYDTDLEASYQTDDSDVNFTPGYITENSGTDECPDSNSDEDTGIAYAEKLWRTKSAWQTTRREKQRLDLEEKLTQQLNGFVELNEW